MQVTIFGRLTTPVGSWSSVVMTKHASAKDWYVTGTTSDWVIQYRTSIYGIWVSGLL